MRHHKYALVKCRSDYDLYSAVEGRSSNEGSVGADAKISISMPYLGGCGITEILVLMCKEKFDKSWWNLRWFFRDGLGDIDCVDAVVAKVSVMSEMFAFRTRTMARSGH